MANRTNENEEVKNVVIEADKVEVNKTEEKTETPKEDKTEAPYFLDTAGNKFDPNNNKID